jgi:hypothetical protein
MQRISVPPFDTDLPEVERDILTAGLFSPFSLIGTMPARHSHLMDDRLTIPDANLFAVRKGMAGLTAIIDGHHGGEGTILACRRGRVTAAAGSA